MATKPNNQDKGSLSNINNEFNVAKMGLDLDSSDAQIDKGKLSYALNAVVENFEANSINYQNEPGNKFCLNFQISVSNEYLDFPYSLICFYRI